jgi:PTS system nitrogen regulatory IIA component
LAKIMTAKEVARYLNVHELTIYKYAAKGKVPAARVGNVCRFNKEAIDRWLAKGRNR